MSGELLNKLQEPRWSSMNFLRVASMVEQIREKIFSRVKMR